MPAQQRAKRVAIHKELNCSWSPCYSKNMKKAILIDMGDVNVNIDPKMTRVVNYQSSREIEGNITLVKDLTMKNIIVFCKYAFSTKNNSLDSSVSTESNIQPDAFSSTNVFKGDVENV